MPLPHRLDPTERPPVLPAWWWRGGESVGYGRLLGLGSVLASALALLVLHPTPVHLPGLVLVMAFHLFALWCSFVLPWRRWSPWALLAFPLSAMAALVLLTAVAPGLAGVLVAFFVLAFAYVGLFLPTHAGLVMLVPAIAAYLGTIRSLDTALAVRTLFVAGVWVLLAELLHGMQRRQRTLIEQLRSDSWTDPLTGLDNRRGLERALAEAVPGDVLAVLDLDHFKQLNDTLGHAAGDQVLRTFGAVLQRELRTRDRAARSGGEEFVLVLRCEQVRCGSAIVERLRAALTHASPGVTFSAGLAEVRAGRTVQESLAAADAAMYEAKRGGRDQSCAEPAEQLAKV